MAGTTKARTPCRPEFILQLQFEEHEGTLERALLLYPRARADGALPSEADFAGLRVAYESAGRSRRRRLVPYRVTAAHPLLPRSMGKRQGRMLWLEPASVLAGEVEALARQRDAEGRAISSIHLRWPDGHEERYDRVLDDGLWFFRS